MITDLTKLQQFLKDKEICLLGNARSILNNKKDIDKFEIVCRMNRGIPQGREEYIGSRTDVLFISTHFREDLKANFNAKYAVWCTECQKLATPWIIENAYQNPPEDWRELKSIYGDKLPSTGLITINFLIKHIDFKKLILYRFSFMIGGTWYHNLDNLPWHNPDKEKEIILNLIKNRNVEIIYE